MFGALGVLLLSVGAHAGGYVTQTFIDTTIQRAYYYLTAAGDQADMDLTMESAVARAKEIVSRLRKIAETDNNKQYILFKLRELEGQIYLEERGLTQEKTTGSRVSVIQTVARFNAEVGKKRPSFAVLKACVTEVEAADPGKADDMDASILDRRRNLSREVLQAINAALDGRDLETARRDLAYCKDNLDYLSVSVTEYAKLEGRLLTCATVDDEIRFVDESEDRIDSLVRALQLGDAWDLLGMVSTRLDGIKARTRQSEWDKRHFRSKRQERAAQKREDSLVTCNMTVLRTRGVYEAGEFFEAELKPHGVSSKSADKVNSAISDAAISLSQSTSSTAPDVAALTQQDDQALSMADLRNAARSKAGSRRVNRMDLVREANLQVAAEGAKSREVEAAASSGADRVNRMARVRETNLQVAADGAKQREEGRAADMQEAARKTAVALYTLVGQKKKGDARRLFADEETALKQYLPAPDFAALDSAVNRGR